jgi:hypothetical protein
MIITIAVGVYLAIGLLHCAYATQKARSLACRAVFGTSYR